MTLFRKPIAGSGEIAKLVSFDTGDPSSGDREWTTFDSEFKSRLPLHQRSLKHVFRKHVKPKKQHEVHELSSYLIDGCNVIHPPPQIVRMAAVSDVLSSAASCNHLIDIGSGVGHLSRLLSYGRGRGVVCVDTESDFTDSAKKFDSELSRAVLKRSNTDHEESGGVTPAIDNPPRHVTFRLESSMDIDELEAKLAAQFRVAADGNDLRYGVVGLHTCGDLGPLLIKLFVSSRRAVYLQSVGCCYMQMESLFPLSEFVKGTKWHDLSHTARELSCHALETYIERLQTSEEDVNKLKVRTARTVLLKTLFH